MLVAGIPLRGSLSRRRYRANNKADGGGRRDRTDDPLLAKQVLSQLSYAPRHRLLLPLQGPACWWVWMDSNHRPPPYQDGALTD